MEVSHKSDQQAPKPEATKPKKKGISKTKAKILLKKQLNKKRQEKRLLKKRAAEEAAKPDAKKKKAVAPAAEGAEKVEKKVRVGRPRNYDLGNGVWRFSRSRMYHKRGLWLKIKKGEKQVKKPKKKRPAQTAVKKIGGEKNGGERMVRLKKLPSYYPTAPKAKKYATRKTNFARHKRNIRKSLQPGAVLIILAGKHRGKRVVFLKQLKTGLLLVTGPFKLNGCPLRRINQIYVIGTKTRLDIKDVKIPEHLNDEYFKRKREHRLKKDEGDIFETKKEKAELPEQKKKDQIDIDTQVMEAIRKREDKKYMFGYLGSMFSLRNHMYPHKLKF